MGGGGKQKTTQTSGLSNPAMNKAATTIGTQLNTQLAAGVKPYTESLVPQLSGQTQAGIAGLSSNPNDGVYGAGVSGALAIPAPANAALNSDTMVCTACR